MTELQRLAEKHVPWLLCQMYDKRSAQSVVYLGGALLRDLPQDYSLRDLNDPLFETAAKQQAANLAYLFLYWFATHSECKGLRVRPSVEHFGCLKFGKLTYSWRGRLRKVNHTAFQFVVVAP